MSIIDMDVAMESAPDLVGPVIRAGNLAEAVIDAVEEDNPGLDVLVLDREDYVRIHTLRQCRLTQSSLAKHLGQHYELSALEIDMPSFKGRLKTRTTEYLWFYENQGQEQS
ncbi:MULTISPECIES: isoprene monooxygenase effector protein [unclassified Mycobacterium]|uniref:isoprene monooxygenase effector protein n=1 Tax=unclassified Mycobacterium TaxID=2642494 RepID=UPI0029C8AFA9|nr:MULTISPECIES: isoprene monooxygenase effector protein [unclassified Mycobacterium]